MRLHTIRRDRPGFTLIELLVVMGLILLLVGITLSISYSGLIDNYKTVGAGDRASGWLLIQKSRATREGAPRGVRFLFDGNKLCREAQYIEVPDPYTARNAPGDKARIRLTDDGAGIRTATIFGVDTADLAANVEAGDTLSIPEYGVLVQVGSPPFPLPIMGTQTSVNVNGAFLPNLGSNTQAVTTTFGFIRKARPMIGEPILQLTADNAIDGNLSICSLTPLAGGGYTSDVLFAPNNEVLNTTNGKTIFWVRNPVLAPLPAPATALSRAQLEAAGSMNLVTVYSKTGAIATQPVTLSGGDPYSATKDGFNTGL